MAIDLGNTLPSMNVQLQDGSLHSLDEWRGRWLVLFFYPKDNTPGCTSENRDFSALLDEFRQANAELIGVSRDSAKSHAGFCSKQHLRHPLIADSDETLCSAFDVIKQKMMYGRSVRGIERSTFLIDPDGRLRQAWRKVKVAGHAALVLAELRAQS